MNPAHRLDWQLLAVSIASALLIGCGGGGSSPGTPSYTIGGTVAGLAAGSSIVLTNNSADSITVSTNSSFTFNRAVAAGSAYSVTTQPAGQTCVVAAGSGTVTTGNVTNISISCAPTKYTIGGTASGLQPGRTVTLLNNGGDDLTVSSNGSLAFAIGLTNGSAYNVAIGTQPSDQTCFAGPQWRPCHGRFGNFYGTTYAGGVNGAGTVFKITATGQETVVWNLGSGTDGQKPFGSVVLGKDGNLYGTTSEGGANGGGTVFKLTTAGVETVLWNFGAGADGKTPKGRLLQASDGNFYGTTESGGALTFGAVYKLTPSGAETVLYSFAFGTDGQGPEGLTQGPDGNFYGITIGGGAYSAGTAFKVTPSGVETLLWNFGNGGDGQNPNVAPLFAADGNIYGVTAGGGTSGLGTLFRLTPDGSETVLWSFKDSDGSTPFSTLIQGPDGAIYGTTYRGGAGGGVVYKLTM